MAVTTTRHSGSLIERLRADHPGLQFIESDDFKWSPATRTVYFKPDTAADQTAAWSLLHETAHAVLEHLTYRSDVELLGKEVEAWDYAAKVLAPAYGTSVDDTHVQHQLDTYRDWLHNRSRCPSCGQNGLQTNTNRYSCINCSGSWRVNDARRCSLKRYML